MIAGNSHSPFDWAAQSHIGRNQPVPPAMLPASAGKRVVEQKHNDRADHRHKHGNEEAVEFVAKTGELLENESPNHSARQARGGIHQATLATLVDNLAG